MNKSLEFVNNRLSERGKATLKKENVSVFRPSKIYKDKVAEFSFSTTLEFYDDSIPDILVELTEAPEDFNNFDCYGYHSEHNDGTLIFIPVAAEEILNKFKKISKVMHVVCDCYIQAAQFNKLLFLYLIFYKTYIFIFREKYCLSTK